MIFQVPICSGVYISASVKIDTTNTVGGRNARFKIVLLDDLDVLVVESNESTTDMVGLQTNHAHLVACQELAPKVWLLRKTRFLHPLCTNKVV